MSACRTDSMIADEIAQVLGEPVARRQVLVTVHAGRVTLRGTVPDATARRALKDRVADVEGVTAITDLLRIDPAGSSLPASPPSRPPAPASRSRPRP